MSQFECAFTHAPHLSVEGGAGLGRQRLGPSLADNRVVVERVLATAHRRSINELGACLGVAGLHNGVTHLAELALLHTRILVKALLRCGPVDSGRHAVGISLLGGTPNEAFELLLAMSVLSGRRDKM